MCDRTAVWQFSAGAWDRSVVVLGELGGHQVGQFVGFGTVRCPG